MEDAIPSRSYRPLFRFTARRRALACIEDRLRELLEVSERDDDWRDEVLALLDAALPGDGALRRRLRAAESDPEGLLPLARAALATIWLTPRSALTPISDELALFDGRNDTPEAIEARRSLYRAFTSSWIFWMTLTLLLALLGLAGLQVRGLSQAGREARQTVDSAKRELTAAKGEMGSLLKIVVDQNAAAKSALAEITAAQADAQAAISKREEGALEAIDRARDGTLAALRRTLDAEANSLLAGLRTRAEEGRKAIDDETHKATEGVSELVATRLRDIDADIRALDSQLETRSIDAREALDSAIESAAGAVRTFQTDRTSTEATQLEKHRRTEEKRITERADQLLESLGSWQETGRLYFGNAVSRAREVEEEWERERRQRFEKLDAQSNELQRDVERLNADYALHAERSRLVADLARKVEAESRIPAPWAAAVLDLSTAVVAVSALISLFAVVLLFRARRPAG